MYIISNPSQKKTKYKSEKRGKIGASEIIFFQIQHSGKSYKKLMGKSFRFPGHIRNCDQKNHRVETKKEFENG